MSLYDTYNKMEQFIAALDEINAGTPVEEVKTYFPDIADFLLVDESGNLDRESVDGIIGGFYSSFEDKVEDLAHYIRNLEGDIELIKAEKDRLNKRQKGAEGRIEWLKQYLAANLGYQPFKSTKSPLRITFRESQSVDIVDLAQIPAEFMKRKEEFSPDKIAIKKELKEGVIIPGARLLTNRSIQIK